MMGNRLNKANAEIERLNAVIDTLMGRDLVDTELSADEARAVFTVGAISVNRFAVVPMAGGIRITFSERCGDQQLIVSAVHVAEADAITLAKLIYRIAPSPALPTAEA